METPALNELFLKAVFNLGTGTRLYKIEKKNLKQWEKVPISQTGCHCHSKADNSSLSNTALHITGCL